MDNIPTVLITDVQSSRENTANQNIAQNRMVQSDDFIVRKTSHGTVLQLKNKHKHHMHYLDYVGELDATKAYYRNEVIRVLPDVNYIDNTDTSISASIGTWICVHSVPDQNYSDTIIEAGLDTQYPQYVRYDNVNYYPQDPEPANLATLDDPNGRYWERIGSVGSGSGGLSMCQVTQLFGGSSNLVSYFGVKKYDGSTQSGNQIIAAKSIPARMLPSASIYGTAYAYTYTDDNNRLSVSASNTEVQVMCQAFNINDTVWINPCDHTGVTVSGSEVKYIEANTEREWIKKYIP